MVLSHERPAPYCQPTRPADLTRNLAWSISLTAEGPAPPEQPVVVDDTPDLVVDAPSVSASTLAADEAFTVRVTVRNRGAGPSGATTLRYYRSVNSTYKRQ